MSTIEGRIPYNLGERYAYFGITIKYIHDNIIRLTPISSTDSAWLDDRMAELKPLYEECADDTTTNKISRGNRDKVDEAIMEKMNLILDSLTFWPSLTSNDRLTFRLFEHAESREFVTVPARSPKPLVTDQTHLSASARAMDADNMKAKTLPHGAFLVIWTGYLKTDPATVNPVPVLLGISSSIECDLEFHATWMGKDAFIQCYYIDKHKMKSALSAPIPIHVL